MGHVSYLGDAVVGAGTNIGAGTITPILMVSEKPYGYRQGAFIG